jgi:hypothetical protein
MKAEKEFILCAAINFNGTIVCGHRHGDCYTVLRDLLSKYITPDQLPDRDEQGFLTSHNRFVGRREAWKIAKENGQIVYGLDASENGEESILISENLY